MIIKKEKKNSDVQKMRKKNLEIEGERSKCSSSKIENVVACDRVVA